MALIISEVAINADGTFAIEIYNTGPGSVDLSTVSVQAFDFNISNALQFLSGTLAPLDTTTVGHSSFGGLASTPSDVDFAKTPIDLIILSVSGGSVDHMGVYNGPDLVLDWVYESPLNRPPDSIVTNDTTPAFTQTDGVSNNTLTPCFLEGTLIATPGGFCSVESLRIGDPVLTANGQSVSVRWVGRKVLRSRIRTVQEHLEPVRIRAGALGKGQPFNDLTVTGDHGMILDGLVINASALVNGGSIDWVPMAELPDRFTVYHIETENHDVILANGAPAETFIDYAGRKAFDNFGEYVELYGAERIIPEMDRPRISARRLLPDAIKARLGIVEPEMFWDADLSA